MADRIISGIIGKGGSVIREIAARSGATVRVVHTHARAHTHTHTKTNHNHHCRTPQTLSLSPSGSTPPPTLALLTQVRVSQKEQMSAAGERVVMIDSPNPAAIAAAEHLVHERIREMEVVIASGGRRDNMDSGGEPEPEPEPEPTPAPTPAPTPETAAELVR